MRLWCTAFLCLLLGCGIPKRVISHVPAPKKLDICRGKETESIPACREDWYPIYQK